MRRLSAVAVGMLAGALVGAGPALAHNELRAAAPARDDRLSAPPTQVALDFTQRLDPRFTSVAVTGPGGSPASTGRPRVAGTRAVQPLSPGLGNGRYTVAYRVVSLDGHPVQGTVTFTIVAALASTPAPRGVAPSVAGTGRAADSDGDGGSSGVGWVAGAVLLLAGVGGVLVWQRRGGR